MANAVVGAVPPSEMGIASGTKSALREIGGVFGIAILASVFAHTGVHTSPGNFIDHFKNALWIGARPDGLLRCRHHRRRRTPGT